MWHVQPKKTYALCVHCENTSFPLFIMSLVETTFNFDDLNVFFDHHQHSVCCSAAVMMCCEYCVSVIRCILVDHSMISGCMPQPPCSACWYLWFWHCEYIWFFCVHEFVKSGVVLLVCNQSSASLWVVRADLDCCIRWAADCSHWFVALSQLDVCICHCRGGFVFYCQAW